MVVLSALQKTITVFWLFDGSNVSDSLDLESTKVTGGSGLPGLIDLNGKEAATPLLLKSKMDKAIAMTAEDVSSVLFTIVPHFAEVTFHYR